jgi:hypothetical protein
MHAHTIAQKRKVSVTLDIECYDDLYLEDLDWREVLGLEGDESVEFTIFNHPDIY